MTRYEIKTATPDDIHSIYGHQLPYAGTAWCVRIEGQIVGIAGVYFQPNTAIVFSDRIGAEDAPKKMAWRCILELWENIKSLGLPVTAVSCGEWLNSEKMLKKLGFVYAGKNSEGSVYIWGRN